MTEDVTLALSELRALIIKAARGEPVRDPAHPIRMLPAYDSGDHLHPNDLGMLRMAEAVDAALRPLLVG